MDSCLPICRFPPSPEVDEYKYDEYDSGQHTKSTTRSEFEQLATSIMIVVNDSYDPQHLRKWNVKYNNMTFQYQHVVNNKETDSFKNFLNALDVLIDVTHISQVPKCIEGKVIWSWWLRSGLFATDINTKSFKSPPKWFKQCQSKYRKIIDDHNIYIIPNDLADFNSQSNSTLKGFRKDLQ